MNICITCGREYLYDRRKGHTNRLCNSCSANKYAQRRVSQCIEYKGGKCILCGYKKCTRSLSFHHVIPKEKLFGISGGHTRNWDIVKKELDKCILLCLNCHMEVESGVVKLVGA